MIDPGCDERVPLVRARLGLGSSEDPVFDRSTANALAQFQKQGVAKMYNKGKAQIALAGFRKDPVKNKLATPSGKIEIYSERLAKIAAEWELPPSGNCRRAT